MSTTTQSAPLLDPQQARIVTTGFVQRRLWVLLALALCVGGAARWYRLGELPRGLHFDEAADGNDAAGLAGEHPYRVFYSADGGREGLYIDLTALTLPLFGQTALAVRFWSSIAGVLTIAFVFLLARAWWNERVAVIAAWLLATSFWHVALSRVGFRAILVPLFLTASLYLIHKSLQPARRALYWAAVAGLVYGLGFYTYIAFRATPMIVATLLACAWVAAVRKYDVWKTAAVFVLAAAATVAPLAAYFIAHPKDFTGRMSEASIAGEGVGIPGNAVRAAGIFTYRGDCNPQYNIACSAELNPLAGVFFVIGIGAALAGMRARRSPAIVVLAWVCVMLLPAVLSDRPAHALRSVGTLPAAMILAAMGADWIIGVFGLKRSMQIAIACVVLVAGVADLYRYFVVWPRDARVDSSYEYSSLVASRWIAANPDGPTVVLLDDPPFHWRPTGLMHQNPDGRSFLLPPEVHLPLFVAGNKVSYFRTERFETDALPSLSCSSSPGIVARDLPYFQPTPLPMCAGSPIVIRFAP